MQSACVCCRWPLRIREIKGIGLVQLLCNVKDFATDEATLPVTAYTLTLLEL